jgi:DNA polymerase-3 subunit beta
MKFRTQRDSFLDALSKTVPIAERRSPLPILSHILVIADQEQLTLTATDLEVGLRLTIDCDVEQTGQIAVPSKKLFEIIKELGSSELAVEQTDQSRIKLMSGESQFQLAGMDASDYPAFPTFENVSSANIEAKKLAHMIEKTIFASSNDESRLNLNGVLFEQNDDKMKLVATDGHRLALINEELGLSLESSIIVPKKSLTELNRVLENVTGDISLGFEEKNMVISTERFTLTMRLIDGEFPEYQGVIPKEKPQVIKADRQKLIQALRRVAVLTSDRNKGIEIEGQANRLEFKSTHPDLGMARDVMDVEYQGQDFNILINVAYMLEAIHAIDTDSILLEYLQPGKPIIFRPNDDTDYFNLVMPMSK